MTSIIFLQTDPWNILVGQTALSMFSMDSADQLSQNFWYLNSAFLLATGEKLGSISAVTKAGRYSIGPSGE